jgi:hypothetical protein
MATITSAPTKPASAPQPTLEAVPTDVDAINLVAAQKWGLEEYQTWRAAYDKAEAARKVQDLGDVRVSISMPKAASGSRTATVGGQMVFRGGGVGRGNYTGCLSMRAEAFLAIIPPEVVLRALGVIKKAATGTVPESREHVTKSGPNEGKVTEQWLLGGIVVESPETFLDSVESAIAKYRGSTVGANGNGNGR